MKSVKSAVSLDAQLFERAEALAKEMKVSRSRLVAMALEDFIRRRESQDLLARINAAWEEDDEDERRLTGRMARSHRRLVRGEW